MKNAKMIAHSAIASLFAVSMLAATGPVHADKKDMEKCYGISKAGKNDCQTSNSACAGTSEVDGNQTAFLVVPKGTCDKIVGGSLTPKA